MFSIDEIKLLDLIAKGDNNKQIAQLLDLSPDDVKNKVHSLVDKLKVSDRFQAAQKALQDGIIQDE